jgi:hypothetical protein
VDQWGLGEDYDTVAHAGRGAFCDPRVAQGHLAVFVLADDSGPVAE